MNFNDFKKEVARKKEREETMKELNAAVVTLERKRDNYIKQAKEALKNGNTAQYNAMTALLKNAIYNLKQAQDMVANFTIAQDMCEMQTLNKHFVRSLNSVLADVYKTCKAIHVSQSEQAFSKALSQQNQTSAELQKALAANNSAFSASVNDISDISDDEVRSLLSDGIALDAQGIDDTLAAIEADLNRPIAGREGK